MGRFLFAYLVSMRPYYAFITGIAGWLGVAFARFEDPASFRWNMATPVLVVLFLSWGVNQIVNDYLGLAEDRINAPHRPMVDGRLPVIPALVVSGLLLAGMVVGTAVTAPAALVPLLAGILLNLVYEPAKGVPLLGNVVFGVMIAQCTLFGYLATCGTGRIVVSVPRISGLCLVAVMNGLMTYYSYFKDREGDAAAGRRTAVVALGVTAAARLALLLAPLPLVLLLVLLALGWILPGPDATWWVLAILTGWLFLRAGWSFWRYPTGEPAYFCLVHGVRACACGQAMLIALFAPLSGLTLFAVSWLGVGPLFHRHRDARA